MSVQIIICEILKITLIIRYRSWFVGMFSPSNAVNIPKAPSPESVSGDIFLFHFSLTATMAKITVSLANMAMIWRYMLTVPFPMLMGNAQY